MDRNIAITYIKTDITVALRKESVDRNLAVWAIEHAYQLSLSARRAWIEIPSLSGMPHGGRSLSARRAWIEIKTVRRV